MTMHRPIPADVSDLLAYDENAGILTWKVSSARRIHVGDVAGSARSPDGYARVEIRGVGYMAHRIAWTIAFWDPGDKQVDHRDGDRLNNRITNLRLASREDNARNCRVSRNTSGAHGVWWNKETQKWRAGINDNGRTRHLGYFHKIEDAAAAYRAAADELHGEFAAHRRPAPPPGVAS